MTEQVDLDAVGKVTPNESRNRNLIFVDAEHVENLLSRIERLEAELKRAENDYRELHRELEAMQAERNVAQAKADDLIAESNRGAPDGSAPGGGMTTILKKALFLLAFLVFFYGAIVVTWYGLSTGYWAYLGFGLALCVAAAIVIAGWQSRENDLR